MHILDSEWFVKLAEKRGDSPSGRLLAIFSIAEEWLCAPGIREQFDLSATLPSQFPRLRAFVMTQASLAGARNPEAFSLQLLMLLTGAILEQLRQPPSTALQDASRASMALLHAACRFHTHNIWKASGITACLLAVLATAAIYLPSAFTRKDAGLLHPHSLQPVVFQASSRLSPDEIAAVLDLHDRIAKGECRAPHLAMLPPGEMSAYMNIVEFRSDQGFADSEGIRAFMTWFKSVQATECFPKHENDHINTVWVKKVPV